MADIIQLLPDHVANQIAAGEVVQRPASVVKELLENAIDAEASEISLIIKAAGKTLIQVTDNGKGMSPTDARLSFERHATSKIRTADDLFNIHTKGFRGEALASIAAIAHVELRSKQEGEDVGTEIKIEGSEVLSQEAAVLQKGTSVAVKNLFYNVPARRNFLKSDNVELRHIIDEFHRVALAHPGIIFSMFHNGNELFKLHDSNIRQRIVNIFGPKTNEKLVPVEEETEFVKIYGFVGKPEFAKKTRGEQFFFVNNRFIKSSYLNHSVNSAFEGLLRDGAHASYFLYLDVDPKTIDINIHPTKTEIKFEDEHTLYAILRAATRHSLGQFSIAPVLDFERDANLDTPYAYKNKPADVPNVDYNEGFNPFQEERTRVKGAPAFRKEKAGSWEGLYVGLESKGNNSPSEFSQVQFESDDEVPSFFDEKDTKSALRTFQLNNKYIVNGIKAGMLVIDQNRAHQRILYEGLLQSITIEEGVSQQLLFPLKLKFSTLEVAMLQGLKGHLQKVGFMFSNLDHDEVELNGVPVGLEATQVSVVLEKLINDVENQVPDSHFSQSDLIAKSLANSLAIRAGVKLSSEEQEHLVNSLFACKEPSISPSNKPTFITMSSDDLDKKFTI
ncbi:MAG: DNA mismatch repair endonuclease MutL [Bacteroidia bacterium]|nr:DNA mismatch repair endonuclease MutL [Bacteroidia bacterium]NNL32106.1 DNA mismatch repair endonuclease MutL [Flavobacteriaceae bacterium]RZW55546.1 MAG: DNA mismatch repair endonuclease MutL [Flavobacteriaceae bacterium]